MTLLYNAERLALEVLAAALQPPPEIDLIDFAEQHLVIEDGPYPGLFDRSRFPFFHAVLKALSPTDPCRHVTLLSSAQCGKTVLASVFGLAQISLGRGSFLYVHPSSDNAIRFSRMKLAPMIRASKFVNELFPQRSNDAQASILYRERRDGLARLLLTGANSPASLSQITVENMVLDDLSKYEINSAGDPEAQAESRARAIPDAKILKISTPLVIPGCRITKNFLEGSQEYGYVPCVHCGTYQQLEWDNFQAQLDVKQPEIACFACVECGALLEEKHRPEMLRGFEWRSHNPSVKGYHRSFSIWSAYSPLQSFEQIAREWIKAKGDLASERTFYNDVLGKAFEARGDGRPWEELRDRATKSDYLRGTVPKNAYLLMLGVDCQIDRCEWLLVAFGEQYRRYVIDYGTIGKHIAEPDAQRALDLLIESKGYNYCGRPMSITCTAIDANYMTDDVLAYCRRYSPSQVIAVRGSPGDSVPRIAKVRRERDEKRGTLRQYGGRFYNIGVNTLKMALYRDLLKDDPTAPGYVAFPRDLEDRFFQELVSEQRVAHKRFGQIIWKWEKPDRQANEMLDCMIYATAAAVKFGVNWISDTRWTKLRAEFGGDPPPPVADRPKPPRSGLTIAELARKLNPR